MLSQMLSILEKYLPLPAPPLPAPSVSVVSVTEKAIGVGNWRGNQTRGGFAVVAWKGGRFDGMVRFQLWGNQLDEVEKAIKELGDRLEADKATLRSKGFLRLAIETISLAEFSNSLNLWFKTADYNALYEFYYKDTDGAESLITRIPISINSEFGESTVVTGDIVRWDDKTAPTLVVSGAFSIGSFNALVFIPGNVPTGTVTLRRTDGTASPTTYPTLTDFLNAVAGENPVTRNGQVIFPSLNDFLNAFPPPKPDTDVTLGDWDEDGMPDIYQSRVLNITPALKLQTVADQFEISYQKAALNQVAVMYFRVLRS